MRLFRIGILNIAIIASLCGCRTITKEEIDITLWMNNGPVEAAACTTGDTAQRGFYRKLDNGKYDFVSWCKPEANQFMAIQKDDLARLLQKAGIQSSALQ